MSSRQQPADRTQSGADRLLTGVLRFLQTERDLFGEMLLTEGAAVAHQDRVTPSDTTTSREEPPLSDQQPGLFEEAEPPRPVITRESWGDARSLEELNAQICTCVKCSLGHTRTNFVFGVGNPNATFMVVGEAPGADEDAQGEPFVGRAGQLLNKILEAINFRREDVYIANILKCRPPGNRKPLPEEVESCLPYLRKQIELIRPTVILCLGLTAAENLLGTRESLSRLRGKVLSFEGIPVMVTYHPAALLRNPNWKRPTWEDVQEIRKLHDERLGTHSH
jgi:uracil-DNA glycosylase